MQIFLYFIFAIFFSCQALALEEKGKLETGLQYNRVGSSVFIRDKDGNQVPAPDGQHKTEKGESFETKDGKLLN